MNKVDLVKIVSEKAGQPQTKISAIVDDILETIEFGLTSEGKVSLTGFGTFKIATRKAYMGRNPKTGEQISIPESKSIVFKVGEHLKKSVKNDV